LRPSPSGETLGLARVDLADHQWSTFAFLFVASVVMTLASLLLGVFPVHEGDVA
jgi:CitMHS family citrate-Mg2+:H+ or citrate-Ca2+:H+ symporter